MSPSTGRASRPSILAMTAPLVVSFWMRAAFSLVDTIYAATIGDSAVASIGLTIPFEFFMIAIWVGLSTGLTSCLARAMGAHEGRKIEQYVRAAWKMVYWASPVFLLAGIGIWFWAPHMGLAEEVWRSFRIYGTTLIAGAAFTTFWSVIPDSIIKAHHDTRSTMWAGIWSNVINVTLNTIFVFVFHWGVFGIALSTVLGRIGGLAYALVKARGHEERRQSAGADDRPTLDTKPYRAIFTLAVPSSLTFALMSSETAVVNALLARLPNPIEAIAAFSIFYRVTLFMLNPIIAAAVALLPYLAKRFGEGDLEGARRGLRALAAASAGYSVAFVGPLTLWGAPWIARWLAEAPLTAEHTTFVLKLVPLACLVGAPFLLCRPAFEAMGRGKPGLMMGFLRFAVLTGPATWLGIRIARAAGWPGIHGAAAGLLAAGAVTSVIFMLWLRLALPSIAQGVASASSESVEASRP